MQQTLTLLAGDSKERENKGGGWKTKSKEKGGARRRGRAISSPDFTWAEGNNCCAVSFIFPFNFPLLCFASLSCLYCSVPCTDRPCHPCTMTARMHSIPLTCQYDSAVVLLNHYTFVPLGDRDYTLIFLPFPNYLTRKTSEAKSL